MVVLDPDGTLTVCPPTFESPPLALGKGARRESHRPEYAGQVQQEWTKSTHCLTNPGDAPGCCCLRVMLTQTGEGCPREMLLSEPDLAHTQLE